MKTLHLTNKDPYFNLALEEYLLKEKSIKDDVFFLWQNDPCIIIGRNQNPYNEVNLLEAKASGIPILRRISGGGTVYHDQGNINFTYITNKLKGRLNNYRFFIQPLIDIMNKAGIEARFVESSHIYIGENKISGNAQTFYQNKMMHHGTLLFDGDLEQLQTLIKPVSQYVTHAVDSTRAKTTNIKTFLPFETTVEDFMSFLQGEMVMGEQAQNILELTEHDIERIQDLSNQKYHTKKWNIGETPNFWIDHIIDGEVIQLHIKNGRITESSLYPDELEGLWFDPDTIEKELSRHREIHSILRKLFH